MPYSKSLTMKRDKQVIGSYKTKITLKRTKKPKEEAAEPLGSGI